MYLRSLVEKSLHAFPLCLVGLSGVPVSHHPAHNDPRSISAGQTFKKEDRCPCRDAKGHHPHSSLPAINAAGADLPPRSTKPPQLTPDPAGHERLLC